MPLYEYECESCGRRFERLQKFSDPPTTACPNCGNDAQRLLSSPAIQFKGSGFYITDYARKTEKAASNGGGESSSSDKADKKQTVEKPGAPTSTTSEAKSSSSESGAKSSTTPKAD